MYVSVNQRFIEAVNFLIDSRILRNQAELVQILGLSKGYVSQIMNGKREPSETIVRKFADLFPAINATWLLTGEGEMVAKNTQVIGTNSGTAINGDGNKLETPTSMEMALTEIAEQRKLTAKSQEQIDRLLGIIEGFQNSQK